MVTGKSRSVLTARVARYATTVESIPLFLMCADYLGNKPYGVNLPYNYLKISGWQKVFENLQATVVKTEKFRFVLLDPCKQVIFSLDLPKT